MPSSSNSVSKVAGSFLFLSCSFRASSSIFAATAAAVFSSLLFTSSEIFFAFFISFSSAAEVFFASAFFLFPVEDAFFFSVFFAFFSSSSSSSGSSTTAIFFVCHCNPPLFTSDGSSPLLKHSHISFTAFFNPTGFIFLSYPFSHPSRKDSTSTLRNMLPLRGGPEEAFSSDFSKYHMYSFVPKN
jgi:hypothetical protein